VKTLERLMHATGCRLLLTTTRVPTSADLSGQRMRQLRSQKPAIERAARNAGARNVRVFGSVARGEDTVESDVDVLVDASVLKDGVIGLIRLRRELEELLGANVDLTTPQLLAPEVAASALAEAIPL
jgi:predicted nucleotidyltransferase